MVHAVFLRAINVGRSNRIRMEDLRTALESLGYAGVRTYLPTGNVVLESEEAREVVAARVEEALAALGLRGVAAMVRSQNELEELCAGPDPFAGHPADEFRHMAIFTRAPVTATERTPFEAKGVTFLAVDGPALLAVVPRDRARPANANAVVESRWRTPATTRWWNVVRDFTRTVVRADA